MSCTGHVNYRIDSRTKLPIAHLDMPFRTHSIPSSSSDPPLCETPQVAQRFGTYVCIFLGTQTFIPMAEAWNLIPPPTQLSPSGRGTAWGYSVPSMNSLRTFSQRDIRRSGLPEQAFDSRSRVVGVVGRALSRNGHRRSSIPRLMSLAEEESGTESPVYNPVLSALAVAGVGAIILG